MKGVDYMIDYSKLIPLDTPAIFHKENRKLISTVLVPSASHGYALAVEYVKKWFLSYSFKFTLDPTKDYYCRLTYSRMGKQFNLSVYDENNKRVWKDTLF